MHVAMCMMGYLSMVEGVYGVWCMLYAVWCMVYGVWCVIHLVYGVWCVIHLVYGVYGVWCTITYGVWCVEHHHMVHGVWYTITYGVWCKVCGAHMVCDAPSNVQSLGLVMIGRLT